MSALAEDSLFTKAQNELKIKAQQNKEKNPSSTTPLLKVNLKKEQKIPRSNMSTSLLFGYYNNQSRFRHPRFRQTIDKDFFGSSPIFSLQPQVDWINFKFLNHELHFGGGAHVSYTQTKKRITTASYFDDLRLSNYAYGLGPNIKWQVKWASQEMEMQLSSMLLYNYESLSSASNSLKHNQRTSYFAGFLTLRYFLNKTNFIDFQKTLNEDANLWNLGFGTLL